jgi:hypothetical protein
MSTTQDLTVADEVVSREVGGETVLLDLASGTYFGLNPVGARFWALVEDEEMNVAQACAVLASEYDAPAAQIEADIAALVDELIANGLLVPAA